MKNLPPKAPRPSAKAATGVRRTGQNRLRVAHLRQPMRRTPGNAMLGPASATVPPPQPSRSSTGFEPVSPIRRRFPTGGA